MTAHLIEPQLGDPHMGFITAVLERSHMATEAQEEKQKILEETRRVLDKQLTEVRNQRKQVGWTLPVIFTAASVGGAAAYYFFSAIPPVPMIEEPIVFGEQIASVVMLIGLLMVVPLSPVMLLSSSHPALSVLSERRMEVHLTEDRLSLFIDRWRGETDSEKQELAFGPNPDRIEAVMNNDETAHFDNLIQENLKAIRHNEQVLSDNRDRLNEYYQKVDDALSFFVYGLLLVFTGHFLIWLINNLG